LLTNAAVQPVNPERMYLSLREQAHSHIGFWAWPQTCGSEFIRERPVQSTPICHLTHRHRGQARSYTVGRRFPQRLCTNAPAEYVSLTVRSSPRVISTNSFSSMLVACFMRYDSSGVAL